MAEPLLTHRLEGEGSDTVLLLNGGMMTFTSWDPLVERLMGRYQVLSCDFYGQLRTPGPGHEELAHHTADLLRLLDHLDLEAVHVLGVSFGAEVGLLLAAIAPERVLSIQAITATDYVTDSFREGSERMRRHLTVALDGGDRGPIHDAIVEDIYSDAYIDAHREELETRRSQLDLLPDVWLSGLDQLLRCTEKVDLRPHLAGIQAPALVVIAGGDTVMLPERSRALAAALGAEVEELEESGHGLILERPDWLYERCLAFLDRQAGRAPKPTTTT